jgi:hypothetical protein
MKKRAEQGNTTQGKEIPGKKTPCDLPLKPTKLFFYYFFDLPSKRT